MFLRWEKLQMAFSLECKIPNDTSNNIGYACDNLHHIMVIADYANMFLGNADDFILATKQIWPSEAKCWAELNRKFLNYLSAFFAYVDFLTCTNKNVFETHNSRAYIHHFEYRFIFDLREYYTRHEPVISRIKYERQKRSYSILITPARLLKYGEDCFQPTVRKELIDMAEANKEIDVPDLAEAFKKLFIQLNSNILSVLNAEIRIALETNGS